MIRRRNQRFYKRELKDILNLIFAGEITKGKYINLFEKKFAEYIGTKFAIATCSGRNGLDLLLGVLNLEEGDEILMPAYTLKDLVYLIKAKGFKPKLIDIEKDSFNINPYLIEERISERTRVILATHIFGLPCNIEKILDIAKKHNLRVIEDCAHAIGAEYKSKKVGSFGDVAFFSFETTKLINTFGGGMITTSDQKIAFAVREKMKNYPANNRKILGKILFTYLEHLIMKSLFYPFLISFFMFKPTTWIMSKLYLFLHGRARVKRSCFTNLQALIGLRQLSNLDERNEKRNKIAYKLTKMLNKNILVQRSKIDTKRVFYFYVVKLAIKKGIDGIRRKILRRGIDVGIKGEITDDCTEVVNKNGSCPVATEIYNSTIQLPMYDELTEKEITFIAEILQKTIFMPGLAKNI